MKKKDKNRLTELNICSFIIKIEKQEHRIYGGTVTTDPIGAVTNCPPC